MKMACWGRGIFVTFIAPLQWTRLGFFLEECFEFFACVKLSMKSGGLKVSVGEGCADHGKLVLRSRWDGKVSVLNWENISDHYVIDWDHWRPAVFASPFQPPSAIFPPILRLWRIFFTVYFTIPFSCVYFFVPFLWATACDVRLSLMEIHVSATFFPSPFFVFLLTTSNWLSFLPENGSNGWSRGSDSTRFLKYDFIVFILNKLLGN